MTLDPNSIAVEDWWKYGIELEAECRTCGLTRRIGPAQILPRVQVNIPLSEYVMNNLPLYCSRCGEYRPKLRVVVVEEKG